MKHSKPRFATPPPLSLYIHLPWCERKCPYCDFNSHTAPDVIPEAAYVDALLADLEQDLPEVWGRSLTSVYIGGGTPSLFGAASIDRLLSGVRALLPWVPELEVTLECNPGSADARKFREFRDAGVNRLSIGIQSFDNGQLRRLGRIHDRHQALAAARAAAAAGIQTFNLDLMFGLPEQSMEQLSADIDLALAQSAPHLSWYQLTIEPNTAFHHAPPSLPKDDSIWTMQQTLQGRLADHGYVQYEVSAYARDGHNCRHNLNYWGFGDYLGIGAGAHAKVTLPGGIVRSVKTKHPRSYLEHAHSSDRVAERREIADRDLPLEFMLNALRLRRPLDLAHFQQRTGLSAARILPILRQAREDGLLTIDGARVSTTERGFRFLNELLLRFVPDTD